MDTVSYFTEKLRAPFGSLIALVVWPTYLYAGLSGPPRSYVLPSTDGEHILVMLSPTPVDEDDGNIAKLPNDKRVDLKATYPASGYYAINGTEPLWTVNDFQGRGYVHLSMDGCHLVIVYASTEYYTIGPPGKERLIDDWDSFQGIRFYEKGRKIAEYTMDNLVDFPRLVSYDGWADESNWEYLEQEPWARLRVEGNRLKLRTSTRDWFEFDITNGEIVGEFRFWRWLHRAGIVALVCVVYSAFRVFESALRFRQHLSDELKTIERTPTIRNRPHSFSLRSLLIYTTALAVALGTAAVSPIVALFVVTVILLLIPFKLTARAMPLAHRIVIFFVALPTIITTGVWAPHIAILVVSLVTSVLFTKWLLTYHAGRPHTVSSSAAMAVLGIATIVCWGTFYLLTIAPTFSILEMLNVPFDIRVAIGYTMYAPLTWYDETMFYRTPFEFSKWYMDAWGVS